MRDLFNMGPRRCAGCDARQAVGSQATWCLTCREAVIAIDRRGREETLGLPIHCAWQYGGPVADAITTLKARGGRGAKSLVRAALPQLLRPWQHERELHVVPVPPQSDRLIERLGHLPDRMAAVVANRQRGQGWRCTWALTRADRGARRRSAPDAIPSFEAKPPRTGRVALLVDDVTTTGVTLRAAAHALSIAGWRVCGAVCLGDARRAAMTARGR